MRTQDRLVEIGETLMRQRGYGGFSYADLALKAGIRKASIHHHFPTKDDLVNGRVQMINWARLPAGSSFRLHYHQDMEETFILVRGQATMTVNEQVVIMNPGDAVMVSPLEQHEMTNHGDEDVEYVVVGISLGQDGKTVVVGS